MPLPELIEFLASPEWERMKAAPDYSVDIRSVLAARFNVPRAVVKNALFADSYGATGPKLRAALGGRA